MISIRELINKIRWDKREKPEEYTLYYLDRISMKHKPIRFVDIKRIEGTFLIIEQNHEETNIPLHRIKRVKKGREIVWQR